MLFTSREPLRIQGEHPSTFPPWLSPRRVSCFSSARRGAPRAEVDGDGAGGGGADVRAARWPSAGAELAAARVQVFRPRVLEARLAERLACRRDHGISLSGSERCARPSTGAPAAHPGRARTVSIAGAVHRRCQDRYGRIDLGPGSIEALVSLAEKSLLRSRGPATGSRGFGCSKQSGSSRPNAAKGTAARAEASTQAFLAFPGTHRRRGRAAAPLSPGAEAMARPPRERIPEPAQRARSPDRT